MDFSFFGTTTRVVYFFVLSTFIYLAFVSSNTYAAPYQSYEDGDELEAVFEDDINSICESPGVSTATRVLCRLVGLRSQETEADILPLNQWQNQRVSKRESSSFSSFQRHVNDIRNLSRLHEKYRQKYQKLVSKGLVNEHTGEVIELPSSDSSIRDRMLSVG